MANYRSIHTKLWGDPKIEPLPADAKYLFLYLITNTHRNESGLYSLTMKTMMSETNLSNKRLLAAIDELTQIRRMAYDPHESVVWVVNAAKHSTLNDNCVKSIANDLEFCSSSLLRESFCQYYANHSRLCEVTKRFVMGSATVWDGLGNPPIGDRGQGTGDKVQGEASTAKAQKAFTPPTVEDVIAYCQENGFPEALARKAFLYYSEAKWHDARGQPVKNWKQKLISVWFKEDNRNAADHGSRNQVSPGKHQILPGSIERTARLGAAYADARRAGGSGNGG